ncbi:MAG TPA: ATP-binding protein [Nitrospiraceae bacterium]|jgi:PAS domain S-box-containing protein|nr:ATP-binding protein [Nitrospiraceae bacterium]
MAKKPEGSTKFAALRRHAEELLRVTKRDLAAMQIKDVQHLVHELQVHEIELEMQNDALRKAQMDLESARDRYLDLYDSAPIGYLTLNPKGMILEGNLPACTLLGINRKDLLGKPVIGFVAAKDQATVLHHIRESFKEGARQACEVGLAQQRDAPVLVRFESVAVQGHVGQHTCLLTALLDITERVRAETALRTYQHGLEQQERLEERERLSHDLHDGILQSLYAIGLSLDAAKTQPSKVSDETSALLTQSIDELNSVMREVRNFIEELGPQMHSEANLPDFELSHSLHALAQSLAHLHGRQVRVSVARAITAGLSHVQQLEILKLVKEALSNSFRHTEASLVSVSLNRVNGNFRLTVQDNGAGFDVKGKTGQGHGLINMAARAKALSGTLSVRSRPANGTLVVLDFPKKKSMEGLNP